LCLAILQSEHIKKFLFTPHPIFFIRPHTREIGGVAASDWPAAASAGGGGQIRQKKKGSAGSAVAGYGLSLAGWSQQRHGCGGSGQRRRKSGTPATEDEGESAGTWPAGCDGEPWPRWGPGLASSGQ